MKQIVKSAHIVLINEDKILIQLRNNNPDILYPGLWTIPGGHIEEGEAPKEAAIRELKEETGYISKNPKLFWILDINLPNGNTAHTHVFYDFYNKKQEIKCLEGDKMVFKTLEEIEKLDFAWGIKEIIEKAMNLIEKERRNLS